METEIKVAAQIAQLVLDSGLTGMPCLADCEMLIRGHISEPEFHNFV